MLYRSFLEGKSMREVYRSSLEGKSEREVYLKNKMDPTRCIFFALYKEHAPPNCVRGNGEASSTLV